MPIKLSIIIVTFNGENHIQNCIRSIYQYLPKEYFELILSDNLSTDNTVKIVEDNYPDVKILIGENEGYGAGINRGIKIAKGDHYLVLNNDTYFIDDSFIKILKYIENDNRIGLIGPKLLNEDLSLQRSITKHPSMWWMLIKMALPRRVFLYINKSQIILYLAGITKMNFGRFSTHGNEIKEVDGVKGCCLLFRKDAILNAGLFDENIFLQTEESDIAKRLQLIDYKVIYYPFSKIVHVGGATAGKVDTLLLNRVYVQKYLSDYYYFNKHKNIIFTKLYKVSLSLLLIIKLILLYITYPLWILLFRKENIYRSSLEAFDLLIRCLWLKKYKKKNIFLDMECKYL